MFSGVQICVPEPQCWRPCSDFVYCHLVVSPRRCPRHHGRAQHKPSTTLLRMLHIHPLTCRPHNQPGHRIRVLVRAHPGGVRCEVEPQARRPCLQRRHQPGHASLRLRPCRSRDGIVPRPPLRVAIPLLAGLVPGDRHHLLHQSLGTSVVRTLQRVAQALLASDFSHAGAQLLLPAHGGLHGPGGLRDCLLPDVLVLEGSCPHDRRTKPNFRRPIIEIRHLFRSLRKRRLSDAHHRSQLHRPLEVIRNNQRVLHRNPLQDRP
mmetsp:Transcript_68283/g.181829  ORF Transcript_68283/g.181829 Transcript_68283/m.181829 type:complete len:262 (-) Transcript_68283:1834-2619(-)